MGMTNTEKPLFKLTSDTKYGFYTLHKWAHDEKNVYGEVKEWFRSAEVLVRGIYTDSVPSSFTLKINEKHPFEILGENVEAIEGQDLWENVDIFVNQRRAGEDYPTVDPETYDECELQLSDHGFDHGTLENEGWELVGYRVGFDDGNVTVEKVLATKLEKD